MQSEEYSSLAILVIVLLGVSKAAIANTPRSVMTIDLSPEFGGRGIALLTSPNIAPRFIDILYEETCINSHARRFILYIIRNYTSVEFF